MEQIPRDASSNNAMSVTSWLPDVSRRSTMSQQYLNCLMLLHFDKGAPMATINIVDVANDFIASNDHMKHMFDTKFKPSDQAVIMF